MSSKTTAGRNNPATSKASTPSWTVRAPASLLVLGTPLTGALNPMTGVAFLLFSFYMVTDPGTTPNLPWRQVAFGACVALGHYVCVAMHISFGIFFSLFSVCLIRGVALNLAALRSRLVMREQQAASVEQAV